MASSKKRMGRAEDYDYPVTSGDSQRFTDGEGSEEWRNGADQLHREDGPAVVWADGTQKWYFKGELHREDGPAVEWGAARSDREDAWFKHGEPVSEEDVAIIVRKNEAAEAFAQAAEVADATTMGTSRTIVLPKVASFKKLQSP